MMDLIILSQNNVLVRNPRKMFITPDDNGDLHICADIANGAIPHLLKLTKPGYNAEQLVKGYFALLEDIETASESEYKPLYVDLTDDVDFTLSESDPHEWTREEALKVIAEMQG